MDEKPSALDPVLRTTQIISAALPMGVAALLAIAFFKRPQPAVEGKELLSYGAVFFAVIMLVGAKLVPSIVARTGCRAIAKGKASSFTGPNGHQATSPLQQLGAVFQSATIVRAALVEGAALLNAIIFFLFGTTLNFVVAAILVVVLLYQIPTRQRLVDWVQAQQANLRL